MKENNTELTNDQWEEFFASDGWKEYQRLMSLAQDEVNMVLRNARGEDLYVAQGVAQVIDEVLSFESRLLDVEAETEEKSE